MLFFSFSVIAISKRKMFCLTNIRTVQCITFIWPRNSALKNVIDETCEIFLHNKEGYGSDVSQNEVT